ncbi:carboxypeptidase-like regulatory domain-containing protein [Myxococcus sp. K38C18041901]|uniref:carboxypeptidase-like regulatory domain-containing protein n=1 Tax=Myxococcus guangdongensis TaxID=2906760 RepID=UPI0020A74269|nr:carboxypeptidase-like regulatory domain-containing protein [Myxococcus guangdongensis]MCP3059318.1 carboxypeptidase-like regulatory domain-containing protein [Myxococcus guangdongensis]
MRGWIGGTLLILGALALLSWRLLGTESQQPEATARTRSASTLPRTSAPRPPSAGALSIQGTVVDAWGQPIPGARVSASWPIEGETISELPCPEDTPPHPLEYPAEEEASVFPRTRNLPWCLPWTEDLIVQRLLAREGEAPIHAQAVSARDGTFVLEGLPVGPQSLWVLSERGATVHPGIQAGSQGVQRVLEASTEIRGQVTGEGAPLSDVSITVVSRGHTRFFDTHTDNDGRFQLGPLPREGYLVFASKEGWSPALATGDSKWKLELRPVRSLSGRVMSRGVPVPGVEVRALRTSAPSSPKATRTTTDARGAFTFELSTGHHTLTAQHEGRYALTRLEVGASSLRDVTLELGSGLHVEGTVFDDTSQPLEGVIVKRVSAPEHGEPLTAVTDAQGRYRLGPVEPGVWDFTLRAKGCLDPADAEQRLVSPDTGTQDFTLARAYALTGRVTDVAGHPVTGVPITLRWVGEGNPPEQIEDDTTDAQGRFALDASQPGDYEVVVDTPDFIDAPVLVKVPARDVDIVVRVGATVEGHVVDGRGQPVVGGVVVLRLFTDALDLNATRTDAQGRFTRRGLAPGRYRVVVERTTDSVDQRAWSDVEVAADAVTRVELRLDEGQTREGLVVDAEGAPLEGVLVRAEPREAVRSDGPAILKMVERFDRGVPTDASGRFVLRGLGPGAHAITAFKLGYSLRLDAATQAVLQKHGGVHRSLIIGDTLYESALRVPSGTTPLRLVMDRQSWVRGRVVGPDGKPLRRFMAGGEPVESEDGTFSFPRHPHAMARRYFFAAEGLRSAERVIDGGQGEPDLDLGEIRLERGRRLRGRVVDARTDQPLSGVTVTARAQAAESEALETRSDAQGLFLFKEHALAPGPLTVMLSEPTGHHALRLSVGEGQEEVTARLEPTALVSVTAKDARGRPLDGYIAFFTASDGDETSSPLDRGQAWKGGLAPGTYVVSVLPARYTEQESSTFLPQRVGVPERGRVSVSFQALTAGATVKVVVPYDKDIQVALVPGGIAHPTQEEELGARMAPGLSAQWGEDALYFRHVPAGRATLMLTSEALPRFHVSDVDVPKEGTLVLTPRLDWKPLEGEAE